MSPQQSNYRIGTSGWHYDHWKGTFYPDGLKAEDMLPWYAGIFSTVEINNSFYRLPEASTLKAWRDTVPDGFTFAVKASRYITHVKKLKDPHDPLTKLQKRLEALGDKLGPILFQLPPGWKFNRDRLESFCKALSGDFTYAFEFRSETWFDDEALAVLEAYNMSFCVYELAGQVSPLIDTGPIGYLRLHGPGDKYEGSYDKKQLDKWARLLRSWHEKGKTVYCYFDNDQHGFAAGNARRMLEECL
ncbi:MAG: DUF72 domain-containing protein [Chitinivibrionales bacterium]|nr:DUF72 domain-containing protein [Chitinivibrionales bacterium]